MKKNEKNFIKNKRQIWAQKIISSQKDVDDINVKISCISYLLLSLMDISFDFITESPAMLKIYFDLYDYVEKSVDVNKIKNTAIEKYKKLDKEIRVFNKIDKLYNYYHK